MVELREALGISGYLRQVVPSTGLRSRDAISEPHEIPRAVLGLARIEPKKSALELAKLLIALISLS